jgi:hypothetical protein
MCHGSRCLVSRYTAKLLPRLTYSKEANKYIPRASVAVMIRLTEGRQQGSHQYTVRLVE